MKRLLTALPLVFAAAYLVGWAPQKLFIAAALLVSLLCYWEYSGLAAAHGIPRPSIVGVVAGVLILFFPLQALPAVSIVVVCAFVLSLRGDNLRDVLPQVACAILGALYTFAPWRFAIDLRQVSVHLLFFALALNWVGDSAAYYVGRYLGRHKLAPVVSPGKSWEGAIASVCAAVLFGVFYLGRFLQQMPWWQVAIIAIAANVAGQFGDLAESAMKRGAGVKDSGDLLPGHGGMLDRLDSSLFALPVVYVLYQFTLRAH